MSRAYYTQHGFNYGRLGPLVRARTDIKYYDKGCKVLQNFLPLPQGPAVKRKGTVFVAEAKDSSKFARMVKFIFSEIDSYVLEFGDSYVRFFQGTDAVYEASQSITGATQADPVVVTYSGADNYANGDEVLIESVVGMTELNNKRYRVANVDTGANTFELTDIDGVDIDGTGFTAYSSGGTIKEIYEIASPYDETEVDDLKFAQLGDIMYIAHPNYRPRKLQRMGATNWTLTELDNQLGPVLDLNESSTTMTLSGTLTEGGTSTWTASNSLFASTDVGSVWRIAKDGDNTIEGYARMTAFTSATVAGFENQTDLSGVSHSSTLNWNEPAWSDTYGYPRAVAFHEQRLFWGGTNESPLTIWGSVANASYENYDIDDASADDAPVFDISGRANTIQWLSSNGRFLIAGTFGGLAFADFSAAGDTPIPSVYNGTSFGSSKTQGVQINGVMVYLSSNQKNLYRALYDDISLQYNALDLNDLSTDYLQAGATFLDTVEQPNVGALMVEGGKLKILSYDESQGSGALPLIGWTEYVLQGDIESVASVPTTGDDRVWVVVNRTIDGTVRRYIEYFDASSDVRYLDSSVAYSGAATRTLSGLEHLEGEDVQVYGDGAFAGTYTVASGSVAIPNSKSAVEEAFIGLSYEADLEIMPINIPIPQTGGTTLNLQARVNEVSVLLYQTLGLKVGPSFSELTTVPFRNTNDAMDNAPPLFGATYPEAETLGFSQGVTREPTICIRSDLPFPCTVVGLTARMEVHTQ